MAPKGRFDKLISTGLVLSWTLPSIAADSFGKEKQNDRHDPRELAYDHHRGDLSSCCVLRNVAMDAPTSETSKASETSATAE